MSNAKNLIHAQKKLVGKMGDYSPEAYQEMETLRQVLPLGAYLRHLEVMIKHIPDQYPWKVAVANTVGHFMINRMGTDEYGRLPMKEKDGSVRMGSAGGVMNFQPAQTDPLIGGFEMIEDAAQLYNATVNPSEFRGVKIASSFNPLLQMGATLTAAQGSRGAIDRDTGKPYIEEHPDVIKIHGSWPPRYVNPTTGTEYTGASLPDFWAAKIMAPKQIVPLQEFLAYPGNHSPWTSFGKDKQAQRRFGPPFQPQRGTRPIQDPRETWGWNMIHMGQREGPPPQMRTWGRQKGI
jgi:hypothetical protein